MNPIFSLFKTIILFITGRLHFPEDNIDKILTMEDRQKFRIFRQAIADTLKDKYGKHTAIFIVRFQTKMPPKRNKSFSLIPMPFFMGLPGFREKYWTVNESNGYSQGIYEWATEQEAKNYANSFAMKFMTKRCIPGSISFVIIPDKSVKDYIASLCCMDQ